MSLTNVAQQTRKTINLSILLVIALIIFRITWNIALYIKEKYYPEEIPGPDQCYQILPKLDINSYPLAETSNPSYKLDLVTGVLPTLPDRAPVYKLPEKPTIISIEKNAENLAKNLGFTGPWIEESDIDWVWQDNKLGKILRMNLISRNFSIETDINKIAQAAPEGTAPTKTQALSKAREFLNRNALLPPHFAADEKVSFLTIIGDSYRLADNETEARVVAVNFVYSISPVASDFPGFDINNLKQEEFPVKSENPESGLIIVHVSGSKNLNYIITDVSYSTEILNENRRCTYSIKSSSDAWTDLINNKTSIVLLRLFGADPYTSYTPLNLSEILIRKIYLAYLDLPEPQKYLQPIYVFEGEAKTQNDERVEYVSYLHAILEEWVK